MAEKRKFKRLSTQPLRCRVFQEGEVVDLSIGGAFVSSERPLPKGSALTLEMALPGHGVVRIGTLVEWTGDYFQGEGGEPCQGMGLSFITIDAETRIAITRYLASVYESSGLARVKASLPARLNAGARWISGIVREVADRALLLETTLVEPIGTELDAQVRLPGVRTPIELRGVIAEVTDAPRGIRLDLREVGAKAREGLRAFMEDARE